MAYEIKGTVRSVSEVKQVTEKFAKRELIVETGLDTKYPQVIQLESSGDRNALLDAVGAGDTVTVPVTINVLAPEAGDPGVSAGRKEPKLGLRSSDTGEISLHTSSNKTVPVFAGASCDKNLIISVSILDPGDLDLTAEPALKQPDRLEQGRLARSRGAEQREKLAGLDDEVDIAQHGACCKMSDIQEQRGGQGQV